MSNLISLFLEVGPGGYVTALGDLKLGLNAIVRERILLRGLF